MHFSSRVDITDPNPIARAESAARARGVTLDTLNDSNPTHHGLAPKQLPEVYTADPRGPRHAREIMADYLSRRYNESSATADSCGADSHSVDSLGADSRDTDSCNSHKNDSHKVDSCGADSCGVDSYDSDSCDVSSCDVSSHDESSCDADSCDVSSFDESSCDMDCRSSRRIDPDRLYLLSSTSQAYSWLMKLLCDPGDAVLAPKPGYPLIESIARLENVEAISYRLFYDGSWTIDIPGLQALMDGPDGGRIRALVLINPNNPSGSYVKESEREQIVTLCRDHGIAVIADEVFYDYTLEPFPGNARLAGQTDVLTFALDGFSKMLAAPHAKVGWIEVSGPGEDVAEAMRRLDVIADDYLPMSDIIAEHIPDLVRSASEQTDRVRNRVRGNLALLHRLLDEDPNGLVSVLRAEGGWNVLVRVPATIDENELVLHLIDTYQLTGQPGYFFDMPSNGYLAVSLLPTAEMFECNVRALISAVNDLTLL